LLEKPLQIVVVGRKEDPAFQSLLGAVHKVSLANRVLLSLLPCGSLPVGHPASGKGLVDGKPTAYVCEGPVCSLPVTNLETLLETLGQVR
jgi:uncharacterized protein